MILIRFCKTRRRRPYVPAVSFTRRRIAFSGRPIDIGIEFARIAGILTEGARVPDRLVWTQPAVDLESTAFGHAGLNVPETRQSAGDIAGESQVSSLTNVFCIG